MPPPSSRQLLVIQVDNDQHAVDRAGIIYNKIEPMEASISPCVVEEQVRLEVAGVGVSPVGGVLPVGVINVSDSVLYNSVYLLLGSVGERETSR